MFRTKRDVHRHVEDVLHKVVNETDRNLRSYNIAKLYYSVGDYESAQQYVRCYLSVRPDVAGAHKLLAQALEALREKEKALDEYKCSLKLESRQPDVVLKVCDLIVELEAKLDAGEARYWRERAEEIGGNHPSVFKFKEYLINMEGGSGDKAELEQLIKKEIEGRPSDVTPRIRLIRLFLDTKRSADALKYAMDLESSFPFRNNLKWYSCLMEVFKAVYSGNPHNVNWEFYLNHLCVLDRYVLLSLREQQGYTDPLLEFDQFLFRADHFCKASGEPLLQECIRHMKGQLCFHLAVALLSAGKQSRAGWKEYTLSAFALLSLAWGAHVCNPSSLSFHLKGKEWHQKLLTLWQKDGAYRCSQTGHVLLSLHLLQRRSRQLCIQGWREKIFDKLFTARSQSMSFFVHHESFLEIPDSVPTINSLKDFDLMSQQQRPDSLHMFVWLGLQNLEKGSKKTSALDCVYSPTYCISQNFSCQVFDKLKLASSDLKSCGVETLSRLDVDSFLFASVLCAAAAQDDLLSRGLVNEDRPTVLPADLTDPLCTAHQAKWWSAAYCLHSNSAGKDLGEIRMIVQRGLEVIRMLGNHGMDVRLVVQLAKHFSEKALSFQIGSKKDAVALSDWALMYWNRALTLLGRMEKNEMIRLPEDRIFKYEGPDLTNSEIKMLLEEGKFFIACRFMRDEQYEKAVEIFNQLKSPWASFYEGKIYKKLADAEVESVNGDQLTPDIKSKHVILLLKSESAYHTTWDRLKSRAENNHPLVTEFDQCLKEVEDRLAQLLPADASSNSNRNAFDGMPDDGYFMNRSGDLCATNPSHYQSTLLTNITNGHVASRGWTSTPVKSRLDPDVPLVSESFQTNRTEARPSPERLEAQMRRMTLNNETLMQKLSEQNEEMLQSIRSIVGGLEKNRRAVEDLQIQVTDLKREMGRLKLGGGQRQLEKDASILTEDDYNEEFGRMAASQLNSFSTFTSYPSSYANQSYGLPSRTQAPSTPLQSLAAAQMIPQHFFPQSQMPLYPPSFAPYYGLNYGEGQTTGIHGALPNALSSMSGGLPSALPGTLPNTVPSVNGAVPGSVSGALPGPSMGNTAPIGMPGISLHGKSSPLAGAPIIAPTTGTNFSASTPSHVPRSQPLPVNVVITSSDVVPTQAPAQQPPLSVTIPPQHRHASVLAAQGRSLPVQLSSSPHNFQISMPPQANIPTSESLEKSLSPLKPVNTQALLTNVPTPIHSAIAVSSSRKSDSKIPHLLTDSISGDDTVTEDTDYNPCADFKPVIPLPEEVVVTTGEEDEIPLFECRAKLYRFVDREWKERGVGQIKILKNKDTGKLRILMRREQIHKICANHFICPEMELSPQSGCDKAWTWVAQDFADQQVQVEKLCVRFKTVQDAACFKAAFDKARELSKLCASPGKEADQPAMSSKLIANPKLNVSPKVETSGKVELGGFSFVSTPVLKRADSPNKIAATREEQSSSPQKPSPFAGFSFSVTGKEDKTGSQQKPSLNTGFLISSTSSPVGHTTSSTESSTAIQAGKFTSADTANKSSFALPSGSFVTPAVPQTTSIMKSDTKQSSTTGGLMFGCSSNTVDFATLASQNQGKEVGKKDPNFRGFDGAGSMVFGSKMNSQNKENMAGNDVTPTKDTDGAVENSEDFEPTAVFSPAVPLPSLVETRTGEEDEEVLYEERARLLRFVAETREWKERGVGKIKVLQNKATGKVRLVMRREQVLKVCCNHYLTKELEFQPLSTSDKAVTWSAQDYADGEMRTEVFALKFKSPEQMLDFKQLVESVQSNLNSSSQVSGTTALNKDQNAPTKSLAELFKPKEGSWECGGCLTRNDASKTSCPCCQTPKPGSAVEDSKAKSPPAATFSFGLKPIENQGFQFGNTSSVKQPSLSEMFKPKAGSWECEGCYTRNNEEITACLACNTSKPGLEGDAKVTSSIFNFGVSNKPTANYTFGIQATPEKQTAEDRPFCFGTSIPSTKPTDKISTFTFGIGSEASVSPANVGFKFNPSADSSTTTQGFMFGKAPSSPDQPFGSPHKFDFKMKDKSPMKSPGCPSGAEDSDEVAEEDNGDDIYFQPVIPLPDKVPVHTGEEEETVLYAHRAKLYRMVDKEWKERGVGDIKILRHNTTQKTRLLMRREQVLKLCLNHYITADLELLMKDEKTWMWGAQDFCEGVVTMETFACRFKNADLAAAFKQAVEDAKIGLAPSPLQGQRQISSKPGAITSSDDVPAVPVPSTMQKFTFKLPGNSLSNKPGIARNLFGVSGEGHSNSDEIQVVYQAEVTDEERDAALKLKLPQNFYRYKYAPPCSGCSGCEEDSSSEQSESKINSISSGSAADVVVSSSASTPLGSSAFFAKSSFSHPSATGSIFGGSITTPSPMQSTTATIFGGTPSNRGPLVSSTASIFGDPAGSQNQLREDALASGQSLTAFQGLSSKLSVSEMLNIGSTKPKSSILAQESEPAAGGTIPFLPVNESLSFSSLAASTPTISFKPNPSKSFIFEGAGSKVFGVKTETTPTRKVGGEEDGESSGGEEPAGETESHDPHYDPIIALPDMVEVRTGEEDEEKLFCQRAKLFRYDTDSKEWKERGVGEMKILKHPGNGTYRLLLRRDQVHKVVLNQRIDAGTTLKPLSTSDKAWCWGGMNYAEDSGVLEELAVRFKHVEQAEEFFTALESCKMSLVAAQPAYGHADSGEETLDEEEEGCEDEDNAYLDGDEEIQFEGRVTLSSKADPSENFVHMGQGELRVIRSVDSACGDSYWVEVEDMDKILCRISILGESEVKKENSTCIWKGEDVSEDTYGIERTYSATFCSERDAEDFQDMFYRASIDVVEQTYTQVEQPGAQVEEIED